MISIEQLTREEWATLSEDAHKIAFSEIRPTSMDRVDYALLGVDDDTLQPHAYVTVRELDSESVYWQFGGAVGGSPISTVRAYERAIDWSLDRYKRVTTLVESGNVRMLKLAMSVGFRIIGCRTFKGTVLCELLLEKGD